MSAVLNDENWPIPQTDKSTRLAQERNANHEETGKSMTKAELAEIADLRETVHNVSSSVMLLTKLQESQARPANGSKWTGWIQTGVVCGMLLISGTNAFKSSEGDLKTQIGDLKSIIAVMGEKLSQSDDRQKERERIADRERALLDERYRQMSIVLESRGIKLPKQ